MAFIQIAEIEVRPDANEFEKATIKILNDLAKDPIILTGAAGLGASIGRKIADALFIFAVQRLAGELVDAYNKIIEDLNPPFEKVEVLDRDDQAILEMTEKHLQSQKNAVIDLAKEYGFLEENTESVWKSVKFVGENVDEVSKTFENASGNIDQAEKSINNFDGSAVDLGTSLEKTDEVAQQLGENGLPKIKEGADKAGDGIVKAAETGKKGLASLGVFAGNIATNIADSFSNFISTTIKGDFDGIEDLWDNLLDSLQDTFADFAAGLLSNPIRLVFESTIDGKEGGLGDLLKSLFGGGKKKSEKNPQNVIFLDEFREKGQKFELAA